VLKIVNSYKKNIIFLAIDQCVFDSKDKKRCDCALFEEKKFYFVEIKNVKKLKQRASHRKNAINQLESTIKEFKKRIDFEQFAVKVLICFQNIPVCPAASTANQEKQKEFWDNYKIDLLEGNEIKF